MARLNESTVSAEPIEILKRRFVRQNREIARVNSIQSLRIRSLESEVSHLLSENVSLREQVITLTHDLERFEAAKTLHDGVYDVKARLDSKLMELTNLISELGALPRRYSRITREKSQSELERPRRELSAARHVGNANLGPRLEPEHDGRLPVILEDKYYPRRTLSAQEIQELSDDKADMPNSPLQRSPVGSPDQTVEGDEASTPAANDTRTSIGNGDTEAEHTLPPNLETRRKKKTGSVITERGSTDTRVTSLLDSKFTRKCGAKRKFLIEDEEDFDEAAPAEDDDFEFSRPVQSPRLSSQNGRSPVKKKSRPQEDATSHVQLKRKVLEPKSTNTNLLSPMIPTVTKSYDQHHKPAIPGTQNSSRRQGKGCLGRGKSVSPAKPSLATSEDDGYIKSDREELKIEVKALITPQHAEQAESAKTTDMPTARPSRRRGAVVSYAEPNLRDKMRRSTNELGPAVNADKPRKSSSHTDTSRVPHEQRGGHSSSKRSRSLSSQNGEHGPTSNDTPQDMDTQSGEQPEGENPGIIDRRDQDNPQLSASNGMSIAINMDAPSITSRKSRRHSSNTKASGRSIPRFSTNTIDVESVCNDLVTDYSGGTVHELPVTGEHSVRDSQGYIDVSSSVIDSTEMTRGQRVAARRRSMML
ncbi:shugoshin family protein [Aspergillus undulatus]|uniref:shugoshin family protein n=1 Tax=Aspergillus undulatus TaxID=1810928 RepID=UPI003CCE17F2